MSLLGILKNHIRTNGAVRTIRVSSAQARGAAKKFSYWGAARYSLRLGGAGVPVNAPLQRASSDRRSPRLAKLDAQAIAEAEGRIALQRIGTLDEANALDVLEEIPAAAEALAVHLRRRSADQARPLSLAERLMLRHLLRAGIDAAADGIRAGKFRNVGQIIETAGEWGPWHPVAFAPLGDQRDVEFFRATPNQELRRLIHRACGDRVLDLAGVAPLQQDDFGALYEDPDPRRHGRIVRVVCPSTAAVYWLPVSSSCRSAHQAVAETFGLRVEEYTPMAQA